MMKKVVFGVMFFVMAVAMATLAFAQPTLPALTDRTVNEGQPLQFTVTMAEAADNGDLVASLCDATSNAGCTPSASTIILAGTTANFSTLSGNEAQFNWTPSFTASGTYTVKLAVKDDEPAVDSDTFTIVVNDVAPVLTVTEARLGDDRQDRSNPNHDDEEDREINVTSSVTVTNSGNEKLTSLSAKVTPRSPFDQQDVLGKVTIPEDGIELDPGESTTVTVEMRIPEGLDSVDDNGELVVPQVADIEFTATRTQNSEAVRATSRVTMQAENKLEIKDARIRFDGKSERLDDDDSIDQVKPGYTVTIELELESLFRDREDVEIRDVEVIVESDGDLDVDESEDVGDLNTEDTDTVEVEFDIEDDIEHGDERLTIIVIGEDEFGALHGERWEVTLEIEREDHEIDIRSRSLNPQQVSCEESSALSVQVRNTGRRDEDEVYIRVNAPELQYSQVSEELNLDQDDEETRSYTIPVPKETAEGTYRVTIETYYDTGKRSMTDGIVLTKVACAADQPKQPEQPDEPQDGGVVVVPVPPAQPPANGNVSDGITGRAVTDVGEGSFLESSAFIWLLVLGYIVVLGGGALVAIKLLRK